MVLPLRGSLHTSLQAWMVPVVDLQRLVANEVEAGPEPAESKI